MARVIKKFSHRAVKDMDPSHIAELCDKVMELGKQGYTLRMLALELGYSVRELNDLRAVSSEFEHAMDAATDFALGAAEKLIMENIDSKSLNSQALSAILRANHPDQYEAAAYRTKKEEAASASEEKSHDYYRQEVEKLLRDLKAAE